MSVAALEAGIAFNNASVTLIHGMNRPIGALFHVAHGLSNAMLLKVCLTYALPGAYDRFADLGRAIGAATAGDSDKDASEKFLNAIIELVEELETPSLEQFGIQKEAFFDEIEKMALVTMKTLLEQARENRKGVGAFSVGNMEMVKGAIQAAEELNTPIILQIAEVPLVLHGGSGITDEDFQKAISLGIVKVNIATASFNKLTQRAEEYLGTEGKHNYFDLNEVMVRGTFENVKHHITVFNMNE